MQTIDELRTKAVELRNIADKLDAAASALAELDGSNGSKPSDSPVPASLSEEDRRDLSNASGVEAIKRVLTEAKRILTKDEISQALKARGKALGAATVMSYLSREAAFVSAGGGRWDLRSRADALYRRHDMSQK